jgi:hypothetical protein
MDDIEKSAQMTIRRTVLDPALAWEVLVGETRLNWIRMAAIALFYLQHWILFGRIEAPAPADLAYHTVASTVVILWGGFAAILHFLLCIRRAPWISYLATSTDLILVTVLVVSSPGGGPHNALLVLYPVILGASALRFSLPVVYFTTLLATALYLLVLGHYAFVVVGYERYYSAEFAAERIPRSTQVIFVLALLTVGAIAGQIVRQARRLALVACARVASDLSRGGESDGHVQPPAEQEYALDLDEDDT